MNKPKSRTRRFALALVAAGALAVPALAIAGPDGRHHGGGGGHGDMMKKFDTDGDGTLSDTEKAAARAAHEARRAEMIAKFDADKNGELSDAEKATMHKERMTARFQMMDTNKDGVLSFAEFEAGAQFRGDHGGRGGRHHGSK